MKTIKIIIILVIFGLNNTFAQVTTSIESVFVNNQTYTNCSLIEFGTSSTSSFTFYYKLTKPVSQATGVGTLRVLLKLNSASPEIDKGSLQILGGIWTIPSVTGTLPCNISASEIQTTGSSILIEYTTSSGVKSRSCAYPLKKTIPPSFSFTPTSLSLACGDTAARTFTVTPSNIPAGAVVTYNWSAPGWTQVGSTTNPRSYQPTSGSILPGPISVTPIINGIAQPTKTCTVTRQAFTTVGNISGSNVICTTAQYCASVAGATTFNWAVTDGANKVTLSGNGTSCISVTKLPNVSGYITLSLTAGDSCGRSITRSKSINIGTELIYTGLVAGASAVNFNETANYVYSGAALSDPNTSYNWFIYGGLNDGPNGLEGPDGGAYIVSGQGTSSIALETGTNSGMIVVEVTATTSGSCKLIDTAFLFVNVSNPFARTSSLTTASTITIFPNPITNLSILEVTVNTIHQNDLGKYNAQNLSKTIDNQVKIFDFNGNLKHSAKFKSDVMSLKNLNLKQGKYVLNVATNSGEQLKTILIVK